MKDIRYAKISFNVFLVFLLAAGQVSALEQPVLTDSGEIHSPAQQKVGSVLVTSGPLDLAFKSERTENTETSPVLTHDQFTGLAEKNCRAFGHQARGGETCKYQYSDGMYTATRDTYEQIGQEMKRQMVIEEFSSAGIQNYKKSIRQKIKFKRAGDLEVKKTEFFDIVTRPAEGKITREFIIHEYNPETHALLKTTYTKYLQIDNSQEAELIRHAVLKYNAAGVPEKGLADIWENQKFKTRIFEWSLPRDGMGKLNLNDWQKIEQNIRMTLQNVSGIL